MSKKVLANLWVQLLECIRFFPWTLSCHWNYAAVYTCLAAYASVCITNCVVIASYDGALIQKFELLSSSGSSDRILLEITAYVFLELPSTPTCYGKFPRSYVSVPVTVSSFLIQKVGSKCLVFGISRSGMSRLIR